MKTEEKVFFNKEACDLCMKCMDSCEHIDLMPYLALNDFADLTIGRGGEKILSKCISCSKCDSVCPTKASPYGLMLLNKHREYLKKGMPSHSRILFPMDKGSVWETVSQRVTSKERAAAKSWEDKGEMDIAGNKEVFFTGCRFRALPYMLDSKIFNGATFIGGTQLCCGEPYYRAGMLENSEQRAHVLEGRFRTAPPDRVVFMCGYCMNMFESVFPARFGKVFPFEKIFYGKWILDRLKRGEISLKKIRDNNAVGLIPAFSYMRDDFEHMSSSLMKMCGIDSYLNVQARNHMVESVGCATGSFGIKKKIESAAEIFKTAKSSEASMLITWCESDLIFLKAAGMLMSSGIRVMHYIELIAECAGDAVEDLSPSRARMFMLDLLSLYLLKSITPYRTKIGTVK